MKEKGKRNRLEIRYIERRKKMLSRLIEEKKKERFKRCGIVFVFPFFLSQHLLSVARKRPEAFCWPQQPDNKLCWTGSRTGREGERERKKTTTT
jgi:hypothetical protein